MLFYDGICTSATAHDYHHRTLFVAKQINIINFATSIRYSHSYAYDIDIPSLLEQVMYAVCKLTEPFTHIQFCCCHYGNN